MLKHIHIFGLQLKMYDVLNTFGFVLMLAHNFLYYRKSILNGNSCLLHSEKKFTLRFRSGRSLEFPSDIPSVYASFVFILTCVQFLSGAAMNRLLGAVTPGNYNYFGFAVFAPFIFLALCLLLKLDGFAFLDAFTPGYAISLVSFKIGCFCSGCCQGTDRFLAIYYASKDNYQFPIQLLEALVALAIFFYLRKYREKASRGTMSPMYLILYSSTRFFTEFLRREPDILWHFKFYHFLCAAGVVIGIIEFRLAKKYCRKPPVKSKVKVHK